MTDRDEDMAVDKVLETLGLESPEQIAEFENRSRDVALDILKAGMASIKGQHPDDVMEAEMDATEMAMLSFALDMSGKFATKELQGLLVKNAMAQLLGGLMDALTDALTDD